MYLTINIKEISTCYGYDKFKFYNKRLKFKVKIYFKENYSKLNILDSMFFIILRFMTIKWQDFKVSIPNIWEY